MMGGRAALRYGLPALVRTGKNIMRGRGVMQPGAYRGLKPGGTGKALGKRGMQTFAAADIGFGGLGAFDVVQGLRGIDRPEDSTRGAAEPQQRVVQGLGELGISSLFTPELVKAFGLKGKAVNRLANFIGSTGSGYNRTGRAVATGLTTAIGSEFIPSNKPGPQFAQKVLSDPTLTAQYPFSLESEKATESTKRSDFKDASLKQVGDSTYAIKAKGIPDPKKVVSDRRAGSGRNKLKKDDRQTFEEVLNEEYANIVEKEQLEAEAMQKETEKKAELNKKVRFDAEQKQNTTGEINEKSIKDVSNAIEERREGGDSSTLNYLSNLAEGEIIDDKLKNDPDPAKKERDYFDFLEGYEEANRLIEIEKAKLTDEKRQTFDEFYDEFRKNAGLDLPDQTANYAAYNFFNNLSAPTNATGMAGFAEAAARASKIYSEDMLQLYQEEKQTRAGLAADYTQYQRDLDATLDTNMRALLKEQRDNLISGSAAVTDYLKEKEKYLNDIRKASKPKDLDRRILVPDPDNPYIPYKTFNAGVDEFGSSIVQVVLPDGDKTFVKLNDPIFDTKEYASFKAELANGEEIPVAEDSILLDKLAMMSKLDESIVNIEDVLNIMQLFPNLTSSGGAIRQFVEKATGIPSEIFKSIDQFGEINAKSYSNIDSSRDRIINEILNKGKVVGPNGEKDAWLNITGTDKASLELKKKGRDAYKKLQKNLADGDALQEKALGRIQEVDAGKVTEYKGYKVGQNYEIENSETGLPEYISGTDIIKMISRLEIIETRMKYLLANVYKEKDRLTVYDLEEMAKNTEVVTFGKTPAQITGSYEKLLEDMLRKYRDKLQESISGGQSIDTLLNKKHRYYQVIKDPRFSMFRLQGADPGAPDTAVQPETITDESDIDLKSKIDDLDLEDKITPEKTEEKPVEVKRGRGGR